MTKRVQLKRVSITRRNLIAKDLRTPKYRQRVIQHDKAYTRKRKHRLREVDSK